MKKIYKLEELGIDELHIELIDIENIENVGYKNTIDLSIEVDETFCINDGIITHNSAKASALAGLSSVGRDHFGVFPLKGKVLNVRDVKVSKITENDEIQKILQIIGLVPGKKYTTVAELRYGKVIFMTDADCFEENTLILTKNGDKKLKDITLNDYVLTHTGEYKKVLNIIHSIKTETIKFSVSGTEYICNKKHILLVVRNGEVLEIYAQDLLITDKILIKHIKS